MLDIAFIRNNPDLVKAAAGNKGIQVDIDELLELDHRRRDLQTKIDALGQKRNELAKQVTGAPTPEQIEEGKKIKSDLAELEEQKKQTGERWQSLMDVVPNIPSSDTPIGKGEKSNQILRTVGDTPHFDFEPKEHWQLGATLGLIDNERAANVSGSRFTYLKGELVWLELALWQHVMAIVTNQQILREIAAEAGADTETKPFVPILPPALIKREVLQKMARHLPEEDRYFVPSDDMFLIGSAEHTMGAMHIDETLREENLPLRYLGFSPSFRREAGSYGKDVRGILRLHQFDKAEMQSFTVADQSRAEQDFLVAIQEYVMRSFNLPYRVVLVCTGEMGAPDARQVDIEVWLPGQNQHRETHTADLMGDYQARRLNTKVRRSNGAMELVHMNDATALAMGRTIIAIMENYQQADGSIAIPEVLHQYLPFTTIEPKR